MCVRNIKNIKKILQLPFILYYIKFKYQIYKNNWMTRDVWSCLNPKLLGTHILLLRNEILIYIYIYTHTHNLIIKSHSQKNNNYQI